MAFLILLISIIYSFIIGVGIGGRGAGRMKMMNIGGLTVLTTLIIQFIYSFKMGIINLVIDIFILYGTAYLFNYKYKGLDEINSQTEADDYRKHLDNLLKK